MTTIHDASIYIAGQKVAHAETALLDFAPEPSEALLKELGPITADFRFSFCAGDAEIFIEFLDRTIPAPALGQWLYMRGRHGRTDGAVIFDREGRPEAGIFRVPSWWHCPSGWYALVRGKVLRSIKRPFRSLASARRAAQRRLAA